MKAKHHFLFPAKAVAQVYKAYFLKQLQHRINKGLIALSEEQQNDWPALAAVLYKKEWIVYFKQPMGGPAQVLEYLGRYTHKVAISNHRIKNIDQHNNVTFEYKDYADGSCKKTITLSGEEFLRRYEQHILPPRFCKIRHYGYLGNYKRTERVNGILQQMNKPQHAAPLAISRMISRIEQYGTSDIICKKCRQAKIELLYAMDIKSVKAVQRE